MMACISLSAAPLPAAVWFFGSALFGLVALTKRRWGSFAGKRPKPWLADPIPVIRWIFHRPVRSLTFWAATWVRKAVFMLTFGVRRLRNATCQSSFGFAAEETCGSRLIGRCTMANVVVVTMQYRLGAALGWLYCPPACVGTLSSGWKTELDTKIAPQQQTQGFYAWFSPDTLRRPGKLPRPLPTVFLFLFRR